MIIFDKSVIIIDKDRILEGEVKTFHVDTVQKLIKDNFNSNYNVKLEMQKYNIYYPELITDKFEIVILLNNILYSTMFIPCNYNEYQLQIIIDVNELIEEFRNTGIKYGLVFYYSHNSYKNIGEFLNIKRLKR